MVLSITKEEKSSISFDKDINELLVEIEDGNSRFSFKIFSTYDLKKLRKLFNVGTACEVNGVSVSIEDNRLYMNHLDIDLDSDEVEQIISYLNTCRFQL